MTECREVATSHGACRASAHLDLLVVQEGERRAGHRGCLGVPVLQIAEPFLFGRAHASIAFMVSQGRQRELGIQCARFELHHTQ